MRVSRLNSNHDWQFGFGKANYAIDSEAVQQNVKTRLLSFARNWFLDMDANIDWLALLSTRNNEGRILGEVERVVQETEGVIKVTDIQISTVRETRKATISVTLIDIFSKELYITFEVA